MKVVALGGYGKIGFPAVIPTTSAAIRTGTHYCDVASFGDDFQQVLQLGSVAEAAGITAIVAIGMVPGFSNLMGAVVARQLDEVEQLQIGLADIVDMAGGRELSPRQWLKGPKESLTVLSEFRPFVVTF